MGSLRDQLMKSGVASKSQAKKSQKAVNHAKRTGKKTQTDVAREAALAAQAQKIENDKAINAQRQAQRRDKELHAQARDIILHSHVPSEGEPYQFEVDGVVRSLSLSPLHRQQVINGQAAIAALDSRFYMLPLVAAEQIAKRLPDLIVLRHEAAEQGAAGDDPYADYQVPDDLMW